MSDEGILRQSREEFWRLIRSVEADGSRAVAVSRVGRALKVVALCYSDCVAAEAEMKARLAADSAAARRRRGGGGVLNGDDLRIHEEASHAVFVLGVRIETFYLYARILLDDVAEAFDAALGPAQNTIGSHSALAKRLPVLVVKKGLPQPPATLLELVAEVTRRIKDFRDNFVAHTHLTRPVRGLEWNPKERARVTVAQGTRDGRGITRVAASGRVEDLLELVDTYMRHSGGCARLSEASRRATPLRHRRSPRALTCRLRPGLVHSG